MKTRRVQQIDIRGQVESLKRKINEIDQGVVRFIALVNERFDPLDRDRLGLQGRTRIVIKEQFLQVANRKCRFTAFGCNFALLVWELLLNNPVR